MKFSDGVSSVMYSAESDLDEERVLPDTTPGVGGGGGTKTERAQISRAITTHSSCLLPNSSLGRVGRSIDLIQRHGLGATAVI